MAVLSRKILNPLVRSAGGIHLTLYIPACGDVGEFKEKIRDVLHLAEDQLRPVLDPYQMEEFLLPVAEMGHDLDFDDPVRKSFGIYRSRSSVQVLELPIPVELSCTVATSFHVKPLLKWLQQDQGFLLLGVNDSMACIYQGSQTSIGLVDDAILPETARKLNSSTEAGERSNIDYLWRDAKWIARWAEMICMHYKLPLFISGNPALAEALLASISYGDVHPRLISTYFSENDLEITASKVRSLLRSQSAKKVEDALKEFKDASELNRANSDLADIACAAMKGDVKKLLIAQNVNIFGKLHRELGISDHGIFDCDHEDDDILDDIAQTVLIHGGEVILADRSEIPDNQPALAIMKKKIVERSL